MDYLSIVCETLILSDILESIRYYLTYKETE